MAKSPEKRTSPLGLRLFPSVKAALEKAAAEDFRSVPSLVEKIVVEWLRERKYLK